MKQHLLFYTLFIFLLGCNNKKNTFNTINFKDNATNGLLRNVNIFETSSKFKMQPFYSGCPTVNGILNDTFNLTKPGIYVLDLMVSNTFIYLEKGDLIKIDFSSNANVPTINFSGNNAETNNFMFGSMKMLNNMLDSLIGNTLEDKSEKEFMEIINNVQLENGKYIEKNKSQIEPSVIEFLKKESQFTLLEFCLFYKYRLNKFSRELKTTPQIDMFINSFNGNDLISFETSANYRSLLYEYHNSKFQHISNNINAFHLYLQKNKIQPKIQDYLICIYATNYLITEYNSPKIIKETYDYLIQVMTDEECRNYAYNSYIKCLKQK